MFKCFKNKDRGPSINVLPRKAVPSRKIEAVIFIPGHNRDMNSSNQGMIAYNGIIENDFNSLLAARILAQARLNYDDTRVPVNVLYRHEDSYPKYCKYIKRDILNICKNTNTDLSKVLIIELHINASGIPGAKGCETLVVDHRSALTASTIIDIFSGAFNIAKRGLYRFNYQAKDHQCTGVKMLKKGSDGSGVLRSIQSLGCQSIIFEPFFGDYCTPESHFFLNDKNKGIDIMSDFWMDILKVLR